MENADNIPSDRASAAPGGEPVAMSGMRAEVHLTRDQSGMCVVRLNGEEVIRDNGEIIDHVVNVNKMVPRGWRVRIEGDECEISSPNENVGVLRVSRYASSVLEVTLYEIAKAIGSNHFVDVNKMVAAPPSDAGQRAELRARITAYLADGGLFNPEFANHDAVRDLLIDCRAAISESEGSSK